MIRVPAWLVSGESCLLVLHMCVHMSPSLCRHGDRDKEVGR